ncbi:MAG: hypothetical protein R6V77_01865 [Candidatus Cloacimonadaceae bacterium]
MKKLLLIFALIVIFMPALTAVKINVWMNEYPGFGDQVGEQLCVAVKTQLNKSDEIKVVFDDNPDHVFNIALWTVNPGETKSDQKQTCYVFEEFFCVYGYPKFYVNSYVEICTEAQIEKVATRLVERLLDDAANFFTGYPQYNQPGKVFKD